MKKGAKRTDPPLWEEAKRMACSEGNLCDHSARKMQWAVHYYKSKGGKYEGRKSKGNSLARWTKQKWRTETGEKSRGRLRYLPDKAWNALTPDQKRRTNEAKKRGAEKGKQYVPQPRDVARTVRRFRSPKASSRRRSRRSRGHRA